MRRVRRLRLPTPPNTNKMLEIIRLEGDILYISGMSKTFKTSQTNKNEYNFNDSNTQLVHII